MEANQNAQAAQSLLHQSVIYTASSWGRSRLTLSKRTRLYGIYITSYSETETHACTSFSDQTNWCTETQKIYKKKSRGLHPGPVCPTTPRVRCYFNIRDSENNRLIIFWPNLWPCMMNVSVLGGRPAIWRLIKHTDTRLTPAVGGWATGKKVPLRLPR